MGRAETAACLEDLEVIPRRMTMHRNIAVTEMDVPAILARRPQVVLVDELAHTNVPGSKNRKRWQDVEEILDAGIHVISTLNIQHLESLYEIVEQATGIKVKERIPDWVVTGADEVVNVDVSVDDLQQRIRTGRVYPEERIENALANFFRDSNLQQLRELTLRELAAQLDTRYRERVENEELDDNVSPDQVMVCMSSRSPNTDALLRYGSRLAGRLNRNWYVLYVQTSRESATQIDAATQRHLNNTLELAASGRGDGIHLSERRHRENHSAICPGTPRRAYHHRSLRMPPPLLETSSRQNHPAGTVESGKSRFQTDRHGKPPERVSRLPGVHSPFRRHSLTTQSP